MLVFSIMLIQNSCTKKNDPPSASVSVFPTTGSPETIFEFDVSGCTDDESDGSELMYRIDWENDGIWEEDWHSDEMHTHQFTSTGDYLISLDVKDGDGNISNTMITLKVTGSNDLIPSSTPFNYNVGINYESWTAGRNSRNIASDLDCITGYFRLIKTFHCEAVGTASVEMDPTQNEIIQYILNHPEKSIELALGTSNAVLAAGGWGAPWKPGLMTERTYTDQWVQMLISSFSSTTNVKNIVKIIILGNEIDSNGPPDGNDKVLYYSQWIPAALSNLKASLSAAGLGDVPVSTTIANYPLGDPSSNIVASSVTTYIKQNWSPSWNSGKSVVLYNQYTPDWGKSADFGPVITYFESVHSKLGGTPGIYIGETGYSEENTLENEVRVTKQIFNWLESQHKTGGMTVPLFVFMAYDHPDKAEGQRKMGIFRDNSSNQPQGLKSGIVIPAWVKEKIHQ